MCSILTLSPWKRWFCFGVLQHKQHATRSPKFASTVHIYVCGYYKRKQHVFTNAGPKGLRAESARAVTGRRNSYSGRGEDFLTGQTNLFTEKAVTPERKVEKWFPRWEINRHGEGEKWVINENWGRMAKIGFFGQKPKFWAQKKRVTFGD